MTSTELAQLRAKFEEHVWCDPERLGGMPCVRGTRFSVTQLLAELADSHATVEIEDNFGLPKGRIGEIVHVLSSLAKSPTIACAFLAANREGDELPAGDVEYLKFRGFTPDPVQGERGVSMLPFSTTPRRDSHIVRGTITIAGESAVVALRFCDRI